MFSPLPREVLVSTLVLTRVPLNGTGQSPRHATTASNRAVNGGLDDKNHRPPYVIRPFNELLSRHFSPPLALIWIIARRFQTCTALFSPRRPRARAFESRVIQERRDEESFFLRVTFRSKEVLPRNRPCDNVSRTQLCKSSGRVRAKLSRSETRGFP